MPKDLGTWGFILSLLAILLMYPVGVLINLTSPKIHNWYSSRSVDKAAERVRQLTEKLHHHKLVEIKDPVHASLLSVCMLIGAQLGGGVHVVIGAIYFSKITKISDAMFTALMFANILMTVSVYLKIRKVRNRYSLRYRARITEQLVDAERSLRQVYVRFDKLKPPRTPSQLPTEGAG